MLFTALPCRKAGAIHHPATVQLLIHPQFTAGLPSDRRQNVSSFSRRNLHVSAASRSQEVACYRCGQRADVVDLDHADGAQNAAPAGPALIDQHPNPARDRDHRREPYLRSRLRHVSAACRASRSTICSRKESSIRTASQGPNYALAGQYSAVDSLINGISDQSRRQIDLLGFADAAGRRADHSLFQYHRAGAYRQKTAFRSPITGTC